MKQRSNGILVYLKYIAFVVILSTMLLQTVSVTVNFLLQNETELTIIDWEEDTDEEETENTNEKTEPPFNNSYYSYTEPLHLVNTCSIISKKVTDISQEIPIPPPQHT